MMQFGSIAPYLPLLIFTGFCLWLVRRRGLFNDAVNLQREAIADQKRILETLQEIKDLLKGRQS